jgi:CDP-glycerol glycerophosphotransferase (TagB/SpsB family)
MKEGFCFVISITDLSRPNTGNDDDDDHHHWSSSSWVSMCKSHNQYLTTIVQHLVPLIVSAHLQFSLAILCKFLYP